MSSEGTVSSTDLEVKNGNEKSDSMKTEGNQVSSSSSAGAEIVDDGEDDRMDQADDDKSNNEMEEKNPYAYLERDEFCSERFKIELRNLPKQYGFKELKKFMMKLKLNPHKIKKGTQAGHFVFVSFRSGEEREKAVAVLNGQKWKNKIVEASYANAAKDPLIKKRADVEVETKEDVFTEPIPEITKKVTVPWYDVPYEEQLERKNETVKTYMKGLEKELCYTNFAIKKLPSPISTVESILPSPVTGNYRNKCEFSIGYNPETKEKTVGFRLASYKKGSKAIGPVNDLPHLPQLMIDGALAFENYIKGTSYEPFDPETHAGVWKQLTVRTSSQGDLMLYIFISRKEFDDEGLQKLKEELIAAFKSVESPKITSLYWKIVEEQGQQKKNDPELLFGDSYIRENICGLTFRISPESFFQVNAKGAEVLANAIQMHAGLDEDTCLLDVCCGTGTLGLSLAKYCGEVQGVDIISSAIEDARVNGQENGLSDKCQFYCGKAEDVVDCLTYQTKKKKIVAILDPPRAGVHIKVLQTLRRCAKINSIIFVSCDMEAAKKNFIDFARPESKKYRLSPFIPRKAIPVDLFPGSPHMELIVVLKRLREETYDEREVDNTATVTSTQPPDATTTSS